jgi:hypothetical protein
MLFLLALTNVKPACADDLTGLAHDDPKDLLPPAALAASSSPSYDTGFLPLPSWSRGAVMPPLPQVLKPMGKKVLVLTTPPVAAPAPLAPPKDNSSATVVISKPTPVANPAASSPTPAMIAVSPFLEWIKSNPQAAEQARQQANIYAASPASNSTPANGNPAPGAPPAAGVAPYWLPPLIDSAPFGTNTGASTGGSSAAIYSTPQR